MPNFDPYHQWLGIPPDEQPPDYYRLLGIRREEDDPVVIENAADRQMAHLKTFQAGPRSADSQRLLNEVAAARVCLLNPSKKNAYDQQILQLEQQAGWPEHEINLKTASPRGRKVRGGIARRKKTTKRNLRMIAYMGMAMLVAFAMIAISVISGRNRPSLPEQTDSAAAATEAADQTAKSSTSVKSDKPSGVTDFPAGSIITQPAGSKSVRQSHAEPKPPGALPHAADNSATESKNDFIIEPPASDSPGSSPSPAEAGQPASNEPVAEQPAPDEPVPDPPETKPATKRKLPVPSAARQKEIVKRMEEAYDFSAAKTPAEQRALARQLSRDGLASGDSDGEPFVLLHRSAELSILAGDAAGMLRTINAITDRYEIDPTELNLKLLKRFAAAAQTPAALFALQNACQERIDAHLAAGRYQEALDAAKIVSLSVQRVRNKDFRKTILAWQQALAKLQKDHLAFAQAERKLAETPGNANAALAVGRWHCFGQDDFAKGLSFLARGSDAALASVAGRELKLTSKEQTHTAADQADLGNAWWEMAEKAKGFDAVSYRLRALHWYSQSKSRLSGLEKAAVEKRLDSFAQLAYRPHSSRSLAGLLGQIDADKSGSIRSQKRQPINWRAYVRWDDSLKMCVNGKSIFTGNKSNMLYQFKFEMAPGDIITVRCGNKEGTRGFCCVLRSERGHVLATDSTWQIYVPKNPENWADPLQIDKIASPSSGNAGLAAKMFKDTGVKAKEIWGREDTSYLMLKVQ